MVQASCSEVEFIRLFKELGSPQAVANFLGVNVRNVYRRRTDLASRGIVLDTTNMSGHKVKYDKEGLK